MTGIASVLFAGAVAVAAINGAPRAAAPAGPSAPPSQSAPRENLNCNDPAVSAGPNAWKPTKEQLRSFDGKLAKVFPLVATKAGIPKTQYGLLHCGSRQGATEVIVVNGARKTEKSYACLDEANFAVTYDPATKTFGTFHFAANLCRPNPSGAQKPK
jgi:hypothetical protein